MLNEERKWSENKNYVIKVRKKASRAVSGSLVPESFEAMENVWVLAKFIEGMKPEGEGKGEGGGLKRGGWNCCIWNGLRFWEIEEISWNHILKLGCWNGCKWKLLRFWAIEEISLNQLTNNNIHQLSAKSFSNNKTFSIVTLGAQW